ncbi:MAG: radical SAM protein [Phycisphaerae bacterium]|nr:radical SAM protein [Phycisphaerae bacterium]
MTIAKVMFDHVLCVYPYRCDVKNASFLPPLGIELIAAAIEPYAAHIDIVDLRHESGRTRDFMRADTGLVCFSVNWDAQPDFVRDEILSVGASATVVVGGRHATHDPDLWLRQCPNVDMVIRGDGEEAVGDFCSGLPIDCIAGVSYRQDGRIVHKPSRDLGLVSDTIYPNRTRRRYKYEFTLGKFRTHVGLDLLAGSRGCPFKCKFCNFSNNPFGQKRPWSARSPESVVEELEKIEAPIVGFTDDLFTHDVERVARICDLIVERGIRKKMIVNARVEIARRPDVIRKMEKAGFFVLMLGIESACDKTLKSMGKGFDTARLREYFEVLRKSSMMLHGYFIVGNIGEGVEEILRIAGFAHELGLDTIGLSTLRMVPHSGLEELIASNPGYHIAPNGKVYSDECSVRTIRQIRRRVNKEFYSTGHMLRLGRKAFRHVPARLLPHLLVRLPRLGLQMTALAKRHNKKHSKSDNSRGNLVAMEETLV